MQPEQSGKSSGTVWKMTAKPPNKNKSNETQNDTKKRQNTH